MRTSAALSPSSLTTVLEVAGAYDGEDGVEDLLLRHPRLRVHLEDGRGDRVALPEISGVLAQEPLTFTLADVE